MARPLHSLIILQPSPIKVRRDLCIARGRDQTSPLIPSVGNVWSQRAGSAR